MVLWRRLILSWKCRPTLFSPPLAVTNGLASGPPVAMGAAGADTVGRSCGLNQIRLFQFASMTAPRSDDGKHIVPFMVSAWQLIDVAVDRCRVVTTINVVLMPGALPSSLSSIPVRSRVNAGMLAIPLLGGRGRGRSEPIFAESPPDFQYSLCAEVCTNLK